ncbi:MAG: hypothetical protein QJR00_05205 [Bacillota bacterium]|nr:hypothetical protein [Bacillota bacterium]
MTAVGIRVQKFGGRSMAGDLRLAALWVAEVYEEGHQVAVVVSAPAGETDSLLRSIPPGSGGDHEARRREIDALLVTGELKASALMALTLQDLGLPALSLHAYQAGLVAEGSFGDGQPLPGIGDRVKDLLAHGKVPVVAGFQAITQEGDWITLGRGGSDLTAVVLAHALGADLCEILTDVPGVYTHDPRSQRRQAQLLSHLTYEDMLDLAERGARVLQKKAVEYAREKGVLLQVRSTFAPGPGTLIGQAFTSKPGSPTGKTGWIG